MSLGDDLIIALTTFLIKCHWHAKYLHKLSQVQSKFGKKFLFLLHPAYGIVNLCPNTMKTSNHLNPRSYTKSKLKLET